MGLLALIIFVWICVFLWKTAGELTNREGSWVHNSGCYCGRCQRARRPK